jgi:hypothetical protein
MGGNIIMDRNNTHFKFMSEISIKDHHFIFVDEIMILEVRKFYHC